ncbi:MAG: HipA domain-containing protein [Polyangiaceae bacterium]|nr:HipA domain-containing protein [Polyangiaceae bacterium]
MSEASVCLICLGEKPDAGEYHQRCLEDLWGQPTAPRLPAELQATGASVLALMAEQAEKKVSISGAQPKALIRVNSKGFCEVVGTGSTHILKPPSDRYANLPANEHASMLLARCMGLEVPPCGLIRIEQGWLYVIRRFDRNGSKKNLNDFCQLLGLQPEHKYQGNAELCAEAIQRYSSEPRSSLKTLFRILLVGYVLHNGDLHLKNLSLMEDDQGAWDLSPVYDMVNTHFYEQRSWNWNLSVVGERKEITRRQWLHFAETHCLLAPDDAAQALDRVLACIEPCRSLLTRSLLSQDWQQKYAHLLSKRLRALASPRSTRPKRRS